MTFKKLTWRFSAISILLLLGLTLTIEMSPKAYAIFGLSRCEKVKSLIISKQNFLNKESAILATKVGQLAKPNQLQIDNFRVHAQEVMQLVWKNSYNYPQCFTNTQRDWGKYLKNSGGFGMVVIDERQYYKNTKYCKSSESLFDQSCIYIDDDVIAKVFSLQSIYAT